MSHWSFWDWIAYGCLGIAALGLAAGAAWKDNPAMFGGLPAFFTSPKWAYVPIVVFTIGSAILVVRAIYPFLAESAGHQKTHNPSPPEAMVVAKIPTSLTLRFVDADNAIHLTAENIRRWYMLQNTMVVQSIDPQRPTAPPKIDKRTIWNLFIVFDKPSAIRQLRVTGGPDLPQYQINVFDPVYAVIVFNGEMTGKTLTVEALI